MAIKLEGGGGGSGDATHLHTIISKKHKYKEGSRLAIYSFKDLWL